MDIEKLKRVRLEQDGLSKTLGMDFISTPEPDTCMARMKVGRHNRQVFGNLAGIGSMALSPGKICLGINVTGNHMKAVLEGDTVTAYGRCIHKGRTLHLWHIELKNNAGELISSVEVTNFILNQRTK